VCASRCNVDHADILSSNVEYCRRDATQAMSVVNRLFFYHDIAIIDYGVSDEGNDTVNDTLTISGCGYVYRDSVNDDAFTVDDGDATGVDVDDEIGDTDGSDATGDVDDRDVAGDNASRLPKSDCWPVVEDVVVVPVIRLLKIEYFAMEQMRRATRRTNAC
jgi:hypothetical protein